MREFDDRIRRALDAQASRVTAEPEPAELTDRIARRERRRTRTLSAALVLALFAGPTLGFVAGRGDGGTDTASSEQSDDDIVVDEAGDRPTIVAGGSGGFGNAAASPELAGGFDAGAGLPQRAVLSAGYYGDQRLARAFVRDAAGARIRVFRADVATPDSAGPPWWEPPAWCYASGYVQADVSNDDAVGIVSGSVYSAFREGVVGGSLGVFGIAEGAPMWVAVAQGTGDVASIRATFPGGASDEMEVVDGVAVLVGAAALDVGDEPWDETATLEAFSASGTSLGSVTAGLYGAHAVWFAIEDSFPGECSAPQELPPPGPEQPVDVEATGQAVTAAFLTAHGANDEAQDVQMAAIDDPTGFPELWEELATGTFAAQVNAAVVGVDDVVFQSATLAAIKYHWDVPGYGTSFYNRFGEVRLVDGAWKVTRATLCRDFALAGTACS